VQAALTLDGRYRDAERVALVMDQLNAHSPPSLYQAFAPSEAKRLADRLEVHHTPKHGSWLNGDGFAVFASGASPSTTRRAATSQPGKNSATPHRPRPTGTSQPIKPASSCAASTHQSMNDRTLG